MSQFKNILYLKNHLARVAKAVSSFGTKYDCCKARGSEKLQLFKSNKITMKNIMEAHLSMLKYAW